MNSGDQLTERVKKQTQSQVVIEEEEYTYSDNGHLTSRVLTVGGNDYTTSYQYDVGGNLKQVTLPDSSTVTYQYDAYGNRVKKQTASEKVSYEYAGGSCQREIHRNLSDTILYTLRYFPWGFTKTVPGTPDVTTSYYYLVDTRGWVWGLTDSDGVIIETYQYSPYGELLSTPTITHSRFLSGVDECLWDSETGLYYLHARYYDPQLGRFIQEDIVEGDLESPATQNRYTYCQNDPVSLIDPSGYSPENTNTLNRYNQINIANLDSPYGCSLSDLQPVLPALTPSDGGEVIGPEDRYQMIGSFDSCGGEQLQGGRKDYLIGGESIFDSNGNKIGTLYIYEINGKTIFVYAPINEEPQAIGNMQDPDTKEIVEGLNEGFADITRRGGDWSQINVNNLLNDVANFTANNLDNWKKVYSGPDKLQTFIKHATVGSAIAQKMSNIGLENEYETNLIIGFWTSYYATKSEEITKRMGKTPTIIKIFNSGDPNVLSLVDIGNLMKAVCATEHYFNETEVDPELFTKNWGVNSSGDWGLMQVNQKSISDANKKGGGYQWFEKLDFLQLDENGIPLYQNYNNFFNIGAGIGEFFCSLYEGYKNGKNNFFDSDLTIKDWLSAAYIYNVGPNWTDPEKIKKGNGYKERVHEQWKKYFKGR